MKDTATTHLNRVGAGGLTYATLVASSIEDVEGATVVHAKEDPAASEPPKAPEGIPEAVGERYERQSLLGKGGMGEVWRVWDRSLHRSVALKVLFGARGPNTLLRFEEEAMVSAQLQHPGIIPVHDLGQLPDGRLWFTMKEVRGQTMADLIEAAHKDWRMGGKGSGPCAACSPCSCGCARRSPTPMREGWSTATSSRPT